MSLSQPMLTKLSEYIESTEDKKESKDSRTGISRHSQVLIEELNIMHGEAGQKIFELIESLRRDKIKDREIGRILLRDVKFISRSTLYEYMPKELKREYKPRLAKPTPTPAGSAYPESWDDDAKERYDQELEEDLKRAEAGPHTVIEIKSDEDARIEAIAQKFEPSKPAIVGTDAEVSDIDLYVLRERVALYELHKCADIIIRQLRQLKSEGWKVVELTARRIT